MWQMLLVLEVQTSMCCAPAPTLLLLVQLIDDRKPGCGCTWIGTDFVLASRTNACTTACAAAACVLTAAVPHRLLAAENPTQTHWSSPYASAPGPLARLASFRRRKNWEVRLRVVPMAEEDI